MKALFNGDDIRQLLAMSDSERQQVITFVEACENSTALPAPSHDAPEVLQRMYTREVKRRKASAKRQSKRDVAKKSKSAGDTSKLQDTIARQSLYIAQLRQAIEQFYNRFSDIASLPPACNKTPQERHRATRFKLKKLCSMTEELLAQTLIACPENLLC